MDVQALPVKLFDLKQHRIHKILVKIKCRLAIPQCYGVSTVICQQKLTTLNLKKGNIFIGPIKV